MTRLNFQQSSRNVEAPDGGFTWCLANSETIPEMNTNQRLSAVVLLALSTAQAAPAPFAVAFSAGDTALKCGAATTPVLTFSGTPPSGTKSYAVIFWDQRSSALSGRWLIFDLPLGTTQLKAASARSLSVAGGKAATNEANQAGYTAVCAKGRHDLYIDYYALDVASLHLPAGAPLQTLHSAIKRHKLQEAKAHLVWPVK
ncbi:hypothetical protein EHF33_08245 [Deinococcus psychrotolerans]|uniref:YbhB/YbcL family Raf kinase inhibitor-like protein n=1 Tax=Deinococcus psychrotolerans TaxID=2489213 RepID=A0A3G8YMD5_9DEIO|nr:hypothetical protein EHF33_08245 [Deinococcus psychrotolerans]